MTFLTILAWLNSPVGQVALAAAFAASSGLGAYVVATRPEAHDVAQDIADLEAELEPWVEQAEAMFGAGAGKTKYSAVLQQARTWLKNQGITGRKGRLIKKYLPGMIEVKVKKIDPKLAPKKAA